MLKLKLEALGHPTPSEVALSSEYTNCEHSALVYA